MFKFIFLIFILSILAACQRGSGAGDSSSDKIEGSVVDTILAQIIPVAYAGPAPAEPAVGQYSYKSIISEIDDLHQEAALRDATYSEAYTALKTVVMNIRADFGVNTTYPDVTIIDPLTSAPTNGFIVLQYTSTEGIACAIQFAPLKKVGSNRTFSVTIPSSVPDNCRSIVIMESIFPGEGDRTSVRRALKLADSTVTMSAYSTALFAAARAPIRDMLVNREDNALAFDVNEVISTFNTAKAALDAQLVVRGLTNDTFNQKNSSIVNVLAMDTNDSSFRSGWSSVIAASYVLLDNANSIAALDILEAAVVSEFNSCLSDSTPTLDDWMIAVGLTTCDDTDLNAYYVVSNAANSSSNHQILQLDI